MIYEQEFLIDSRDVDLTGCARPSAVLGYLQEAATGAAMDLHVSGQETRQKYNAFWMVARTWFHLDKPLRWDEKVLIRTWHRGGRSASSYRDFDLLQDGKVIGEAVTTWVLADCDTFKLVRIDKLEEFQGTDGGELCKDKMLRRVRMPGEAEAKTERVMRYSDTDINGHVNNVKYADFACDALHMEELLPGKFLSELQISYTNQCRAGETLIVETLVRAQECWICGMGSANDERFDCCLKLEEM